MPRSSAFPRAPRNVFSSARRVPKGLVALIVATIGVMVTLAGPAFACGGLVAPNGSVQLQKTSTLAAYIDGNEHYITSFNFTSTSESFGSIVPIPGEPTKVERAGDWTLQRLVREVAPAVPAAASEDRASAGAAAPKVSVLQEKKIDSLDIKIVKGGGKEVAEWAEQNGFTLDAGTPKMLEFYSARSPYFMTTKFDAKDAKAKNLQTGDGIPIALTIPTRNPWVPIKILSLGKEGTEIVDADVFLLTDDKPAILSTPGAKIARSERASASLLSDLRSDKNSEWVPQKAWFTYLRINGPASQLTQDLAIDTSGRDQPSLIDAGLAAPTGLGIDSGGNSTSTRVAASDPRSAFAGPTTPELAQTSGSSGLAWLAIIGAILAGVAITLIGSIAFFTRNPVKVVTTPGPGANSTHPTDPRHPVGHDSMPSSPPLR